MKTPEEWAADLYLVIADPEDLDLRDLTAAADLVRAIRREALEEAARAVDEHEDASGSRYIRALANSQ